MLGARELNRAGKGTNRAKYLFFLSVIFALSVGSASYFKDGGIRSLMDRDRKIERERMQVKRLKAENSLLRRRIRSIHDDSFLIEKYAREKLHLVKENEKVFRFFEDPHPYR
ncbi:MAG: septum formation initiator family protein [Nitrospinota bacterium]